MADEKKTLEQQFFAWDGWDEYDVLGLQFYDCKMVADLGPLKAGHEYDVITLDYSTGTCEAYKSGDDEPSISFKFTLTPAEVK